MKEVKMYYSWQEAYSRELGLVPPDELRGIPDCGLVLPGSDIVYNRWKTEQTPVTLNAVVVSPNEGDLPVRAMSYLANTIQIARSLRHSGINTQAIRIINPCYLNVYCDDGYLDYQLAFGQSLHARMGEWKAKYFSDMGGTHLLLDQGMPIEKDLIPQAEQYASSISRETYATLASRISNHNGYHKKMALYLMAHPLAWQYVMSDALFISKTHEMGIINYMPQSEMLFLTTMRQAGIAITPQESNVITLVSRRIINAPYYYLKDDEPSMNWSVHVTDLQNEMGALRPRAGHMHYAEILASLGHLRTFMQNHGRT